VGSGVGAVMTTVGIIGSGMIGGAVARLSAAAGQHVVLGPFSDEAGTPADAARIHADLVGAYR
jgi:predicted dinucleotide-binding enzyme